LGTRKRSSECQRQHRESHPTLPLETRLQPFRVRQVREGAIRASVAEPPLRGGPASACPVIFQSSSNVFRRQPCVALTSGVDAELVLRDSVQMRAPVFLSRYGAVSQRTACYRSPWSARTSTRMSCSKI
jgi:hypothetical protein